MIIVVADQFTKSLATTYLSNGGIVRPFNGDTIWLIYVLNPGFAFGVRILPPIVLKIFALLAASALGYYLFTRCLDSIYQNISLTLIMGGALGNLIDRIRIGEVIDFLSVDMPDFFMDRFPVFNVADSMVSIGVVLLILLSFKAKEIPAIEETDSEVAPPSESINSSISEIDLQNLPEKGEH